MPAHTFARRLFLPPPRRRVDSAKRVRWLALVRAGVLVTALLGNLIVFGILHGAPGVRDDVVERGAAINVRGEDLRAVLRRRGRNPPDELIPLVHQIAAALDAAHDAGIVHRDLKPENIVLCADQTAGAAPRIKLLDFGIARLLEDADSEPTRTAAVLGSPGYMAPELARQSLGELGPHTDVFAVGAIVYRACTGKHAFPSRRPAAAIDEAINLHPPAPTSLVPELPADLDRVLAVALAKRPADRYLRASALAAELHHAPSDGLPPTARARTHEPATFTEPLGDTLGA